MAEDPGQLLLLLPYKSGRAINRRYKRCFKKVYMYIVFTLFSAAKSRSSQSKILRSRPSRRCCVCAHHIEHFLLVWKFYTVDLRTAVLVWCQLRHRRCVLRMSTALPNTDSFHMIDILFTQLTAIRSSCFREPDKCVQLNCINVAAAGT